MDPSDIPSVPVPSFPPEPPQSGDVDPYSTWPDGETFNDLRVMMNIGLSKFNVPKEAIIALFGKGLNITSEEKVHDVLVEMANHPVVDKYREEGG